MRVQVTLLSLVVATALSASTVFAMTPSKDAQKQVKEQPEIEKGVEGLKRQGEGGLGNENDDKTLKGLEEPIKDDSTPASGDDTKKNQ